MVSHLFLLNVAQYKVQRLLYIEVAVEKVMKRDVFEMSEKEVKEK